MQEDPTNKLIVGHLNITVIRNNFETLEDLINIDLDIILLTNNSSCHGKFILNVYFIIYRVDRISKVRGLLYNQIVLAITFNLELKFMEHISKICNRVNEEINILYSILMILYK